MNLLLVCLAFLAIHRHFNFAASTGRLTGTASFHFDLKWSICSPDGGFERQCLLVNGLNPGPPVYAVEGDTIEITINNLSLNHTSIHWHGLLQQGTNRMDGVAGTAKQNL